jgi:hypothetical protein
MCGGVRTRVAPWTEAMCKRAKSSPHERVADRVTSRVKAKCDRRDIYVGQAFQPDIFVGPKVVRLESLTCTTRRLLRIHLACHDHVAAAVSCHDCRPGNRKLSATRLANRPEPRPRVRDRTSCDSERRQGQPRTPTPWLQERKTRVRARPLPPWR